MDIKLVGEKPGVPMTDAKHKPLDGVPLPAEKSVIPSLPDDKLEALPSGKARPMVPLIEGADRDHDGKIDRALWNGLADLVGLKEIDGVPLADCTDAQVRREVLYLMGVDRVEAMEMPDEAAFAVVQTKVKEMIGQAVDEHKLFAKQHGFKKEGLKAATQIYREVYYRSHRLEVAERVGDLQKAHQQLAIAQAGLAKLGKVAAQIFPISELIKPDLDVAVHPPALPPKPPATVTAAMDQERKHPPRPAKDPFKTDLWQMAQGLLTNGARDKESKHPLTHPELAQMMAFACKDGLVTPEERELLLLVMDHDNAKVLEAAARSGKPPDKKKLVAVDPDQPYGDGKTLGVWLDDKLDQTLSAKEIGGGAAATPALLRKEAAAAKIVKGGLLDLDTRDGRYRILDRLSQNAQSDAVGDSSCSATSMVALAVSEGKEGVRNLCLALLRENPTSEPAKRMLKKLQEGGMSVKDLGDLAESLYLTLNAQEAKKGDKRHGLTSAPDFLHRNRDLTHVLFRSGGSLVSLDTDGDASVNHAVAFIPGPGGKDIVFEPSEADWGHDPKGFGWQEESGRVTRHHLLNDPNTLTRYRLAAHQLTQVLDPKIEKAMQG